ncbi:hypothetical protein ABBQ32_002192 [Trebouxia sp. C0010 RCD-2024]
MGGHGGLNILPQKSWNVYGRENRLKVSRDEAKFEEENKLKRERHVQAEREARRAALLQRARQRQAEHQTSDIVQEPCHADSTPAQLPASGSAHAGAALVAEPLAVEVQAKPPGSTGKLLKHINFWHEDELKMAHPEVQAEKKSEQKRRGNKETQTSDAKFDEQFKLGHQMAAQPWYSRKVPPLPFEESQQLPDNGQRIALTAGTDLLLTNAAVRKHKHSKQRKDKKSKKVKNSDQEAAKAKSVEVLRAERQAREQAERARQDRLLRAHRGFAQPAAR